MERGLFIQMLGWKIGSEGASSVPPDSFLIGPLKGHSRLPMTFPPKQIVVVNCTVYVIIKLQVQLWLR